MTDILRAAQAWLPDPRFHFVGGPADGRLVVVDLIETDDGYVAPGFWRVAVEPPRRVRGPTPPAMRVHTYRFVPRGPNVGHYEHVG